jgi:Protein of unknown function (DUF3370)
MLEFLSIVSLAQVVTAPPTSSALSPNFSREIMQPQEVRPLPGQLDTVPVFNSNSPELIQSEGILLSTFPPDRMRTPSAHLNYPLQGRFDVFEHHVARGLNPDDVRTMYISTLVYNPTNRPISIDILQAASYLSQEAPFRDLPAYVANPLGTVFAGPGSRTMNDVLRGQRQADWPDQIIIPPRSSQLLFNLPIPLRSMNDLRNGVPLPQYLVPFPLPNSNPSGQTATLLGNGNMPSQDSAPGTGINLSPNRTPPTNGRTVLMHLNSDGPVYMASLAMYARLNADGSERAPSIWEWQSLLLEGNLAGPRDTPPTPPDRDYFSRFFYGRVAGVAQGSQWTGQITDAPGAEFLSVPPSGHAISYGIGLLDRGTFGTGQIQSAPMLVRYPDTAYRAHGNYGVYYNLTIPLQNNSNTPQTVGIMLQTPLKEADNEGGLRFLDPPDDQIFFRGTVRIRYNDDFGVPVTRYLHVVQRRGQAGEPLIRLNMPAGDRRLVQVEFLYPPDSTPPQMLTVQTLDTRAALTNTP